MEWTNVRDNLPENVNKGFIRCIVCRKTVNQNVFEAMFNPKTGEFQQLSFERLDQITHWMELPSPPIVRL